jgi:N-acetylglucosaminyl-diphospho-decaprenol L-rhamnosyltransferase
VISIVIANWNSGALLESCVRSLLENAAGCEIIVVDNASTDSSLNFAEEIRSSLTIIRNDRNAGYAAANNLGWRASKGDPVLFLNPDTKCFPDSAALLEQAFTIDKMVCAVGGRLISPSGKPQSGFNVRAFPTLGRVAAEMLFIDKIRPFKQWLQIDCTAGSGAPMDADQPAAACLMVSKRVLETLKGFDENFYPAWFEDVDLCRRIHNQGGRILYHPGARFMHHGGYSLASLPRQNFLESIHTNQIRYFKKHHGPRTAACVRRLIILGLLLRCVLSLVYPLAPKLSRAASIKAFWKAARNIPLLREVKT